MNVSIAITVSDLRGGPKRTPGEGVIFVPGLATGITPCGR
jgi:hypothetical protein